MEIYRLAKQRLYFLSR
ncbi:MAG: DUF1891 domain-containing protein [Burkholderiaceae bacterium]|nr:MAG: DUF1891 domain-containing protein [Burkholderiaceae bacterium]